MWQSRGVSPDRAVTTVCWQPALKKKNFTSAHLQRADLLAQVSQTLPVSGELLAYQQLQRTTFLRHAGVITAATAATAAGGAAMVISLCSLSDGDRSEAVCQLLHSRLLGTPAVNPSISTN